MPLHSQFSLTLSRCGPRAAAASLIALAIAASIDGMDSASAQATWNSAVSGTWGDTANWSTGVVPGLGNNTAAVLTNTSASYTVTYDTTMTGTLASLALTNITSNTTRLNVDSGALRAGATTLAGATITVSNGASLSLGQVTGTTSTIAAGRANIIVQGGLYASGGNIGNNGTVNLTVTSGSVSHTSGFFFPSLTMSGGQVTVASGAPVGTISGGTYTESSSMQVRNGTLTLSGSGQIRTNGFYLSGNNETMQVNGGSFEITGTSFTLMTGTTYAATKTATFNQTSGTVSMANAAGLVVGNASGTAIASPSVNAYNFSGGTLTLEKITLAAPGYSGAGTNRFAMSGGTLNLGSGGLVIGTGSGTKEILLSGGTVAASANWSTSANMSLRTNTGSGTATFQAADASNVARNITLSGVLSGSGALAKTGGGVLALQNANTYLGATTIAAGRLQIDAAGSINSTSGITINGSGAELKYNSSTALSRTLTVTQGTISGTGTIGTAVTVGTGGILSPGNSPGIQAYTSGLTWAPGGQYTWEINDWTGTAGTNYDQLAVSGSALNVTATSGSTFTIQVTSLTGLNAAGAVPGFVGSTGTAFTIATSAVPITGFDKTKFAIDSSTAFGNVNSVPANAGFWLTTNAGSTSLILNYAPSATYDLSTAASATAIRVGGTSTITASILSSTASLTNPDTLAYGGLALSGGVGSLSSTSGTLAPGTSRSGNALFTGTAPGAFTFTPSVTSGTNVNIGTVANTGSTSGVTVSVYTPAAAGTLASPLALGTVLKGSSLSQSLSITNTAPNGGYSERLDAAFGPLGGAATTNSGSINLLAPQSSSTAMAVGLSTATAGLVSGTVQINFTSNGEGTSGLGTLALSPQAVSLSATVLDSAVASFTSGSTTTSLLLDFGSVNQNASVSPLGFDLFNLLQTSGYTADLALIDIVSGTGNTGAFTTTLSSTFNNLAAGGSPYAYTASFDTSGLGAFLNTYTLRFKSANGGTVYNDDTVQSLSLTVQGIIVVPEPGTAAAAGIGLAIVGWALWRRRRHAHD
ncbi:MAG: choice-of-anchor D domain-containing protein [Planctomycetia bacterium]|nr:choice-of-anchor D domain-containing protein [Planctomycetia bacterium]